jgi:TatD DNase family protein
MLTDTMAKHDASNRNRLATPVFDSHCHLQDERIVNDIDGIIARALAAGVEMLLCCGSSEGDWQSVLSLADRFPLHRIPALGVHPWYVAEQYDGCLKRLEAILESDSRIAVGEIGLDHASPQRNDALQMRFFHGQLLLAGRLHRSVSIHCRKAWGSLMDLFRYENLRRNDFHAVSDNHIAGESTACSTGTLDY